MEVDESFEPVADPGSRDPAVRSRKRWAGGLATLVDLAILSFLTLLLAGGVGDRGGSASGGDQARAPSPRAAPASFSSPRRLQSAFERALDTGELSAAEYVSLSREYGRDLSPVEGGSRNAMAAAAVRLSGRDWLWDVPLEDIQNHRGSWSPAWGWESFSPQYSGQWAAALAVLFDRERSWWTAAKPWLIGHALAAGPVPEVIRLESLGDPSPPRRLTGSAAWRWGRQAVFSIHPGDRFLWQIPLSANTLIERAVAHPLVSLAADRSVQIENWKHPSFGLPLRAILDGKATRPIGWGPPLKLGREAVEHLAELPPLPGGVWHRYRWYADGTRAVALSHGRTSTRGTVVLAMAKGGSVTYYTAARPRGSGGRWTRSQCRLEGSTWILESSDGRFQVEEPSPVELSVLWDRQGARIEE